ncbi:MAG: UPF0149 family protein [Steroidobacteraceae bacterium]
MTAPADFDDVARALAAVGATVGAAEAHGCLCGAVSARRDYGLADWLEEIVPDEGHPADPRLAALIEATLTALGGDEMAFEPLLPDDDVALGERVEALGTWCQGYLYGFGAAGTAGNVRLPDDVAEVLGDFAQLGQAGAVGSADDAVEEEAYAELVEFLRAAVQLVYDELAPLRATQPANHTDH